MQTRHRLELHPQRRRVLHLDHQHRPRLHQQPTIQWTAKKSEITSPYPPPLPTLEEVHAEEDAAHERLIANWRHELDQATEDADPERTTLARRALAEAENQRQQQLASRVEPEPPPF
jgi:hypothetical protein